MSGTGLRIAQFILIGSTVFLLSLPAQAERLAWNQERVTELAVKLTQSLAATVAAAAEAPPQVTVLQQRTHDAAFGRLDRVRAATAELVTKLEAGWGRDETAPHFWQVQVLLRETNETAGGAVHYKRMGKSWTASLELTHAIARYYGEG